MGKSNPSAVLGKPSRPPGFPLFAHATHRWAKKVRGKLCYFGPWSDPDAALNKWLDQKDDLLAGRTPRAAGGGLTMKDLANRFMSAKQASLDSGEITPRTFADYYATCERLLRVLGKNRRVDDLAVDDFDLLRADIAKTRGPVALGNEIQRCRSALRYAHDQGLITAPVRYGQSFRKPSRKTLRKARATSGSRMLEAADLQKIIKAADVQMKAMVLLAINGALGQSDLSALPLSALDLDRGWLVYPRVKTGIERRIPLWRETVAAVKAAIAARPTPKHEPDAALVFITKYGQRWVKTNQRGTPADALGQEFSKVLTELGIKRPGVGFYAIRHSFRTVADATRDFPAIDLIMGHSDTSMASHYRERIEDGRLQAVVAHVRAWLFGKRKAR